MSEKLWAPRHPDGCHIGLTNGRTFLVPHDKAGAEVPQMFRREALACGCIPVGMEPEEAYPDIFDRVAMIRRAEARGNANARALDSAYQAVPPPDPAASPRAPPETTHEAIVPRCREGTSVDERTAEVIMRCLQQAGEEGLSRTEISGAFKRNLSAERIGAALESLRGTGRAVCKVVPTRGRPAEVWRASK